MNQPFDEELISAYLDDELSAEQRRDVERLLAERPEAQRLLDELRGLRESLQSLPTFKLQEDFGAAVLRRAEREMLRTGPAASTAPSAESVTPVTNAAATPIPAVQPASQVERNWRRPAAWSLLAVAAALALMFVERNRRDSGDVAMVKVKQENADAKSGTPALSPARPETSDAVAAKKLDRADESAGRELLLKDGSARSRGNDAPAAVAAPAPKEGTAEQNRIAGQPVPMTNQFIVANTSVPPPGSVPPAAAIVPPTTTAAAKPADPAMIAGAQFAIENRLPARGPATPAPVAGNATGDSQNALAQQVLAGGGAGGYALPSQLQQGVVDMTPLIRANDFQRARALVSEYEIARREVTNERDAAAQVSRRLQNRALELQTAQRITPAASKAGPAAEKQQSPALATDADQLLIVYCDVTPEAIERGWTTILNREQIADLTTPYGAAGMTAVNGLLEKAPTDQRKEQAGVADEEFVYVVADSKQLEGTLDALRRQSEFFLNVRVEPAPSDSQQQVWRQRYSRGEETSLSSGYTVKSGPVATPSPAPAGPALGAVAASPAPTAAPKSAGEEVGERKQAGNKPTAEIAKSESAASSAPPLNGIPQLREAEVEKQLFGGGNALSGLGNSGGSAAAGPVPAASQSAVESAYGYYRQQQNFAPLSRSQRLSRADALAPSIADAAGNGLNRGVNPATTTPAAPLAASAPPAAAANPAVPTQDRADNQRADKSKVAGGGGAGVQLGVAAKQVDADAQFAGAAGQNLNWVWNELPPDYHEALFIFRVVPPPKMDGKPTK